MGCFAMNGLDEQGGEQDINLPEMKALVAGLQFVVLWSGGGQEELRSWATAGAPLSPARRQEARRQAAGGEGK